MTNCGEAGARLRYIWLKNDDADAIVAAKEFGPNDKGPYTLSATVTPGRTYAPCCYCATHGLWLGRAETA